MLNFIDVNKRLKLINTNTSQIFLNYIIKDIDGRKVVGKDIWNKFKELIQNNEISYARKKIELSKIKSKLNLFIYEIYTNNKSGVKYYDEEFGNIYYIENGKEFITDGKFDREKYMLYIGEIFL